MKNAKKNPRKRERTTGLGKILRSRKFWRRVTVILYRGSGAEVESWTVEKLLIFDFVLELDPAKVKHLFGPETLQRLQEGITTKTTHRPN